MSFETAKEFEKYARHCVTLASADNAPPELRRQLLEMAHEWMRALIEEQEGTRPGDVPQNE